MLNKVLEANDEILKIGHEDYLLEPTDRNSVAYAIKIIAGSLNSIFYLC